MKFGRKRVKAEVVEVNNVQTRRNGENEKMTDGQNCDRSNVQGKRGQRYNIHQRKQLYSDAAYQVDNNTLPVTKRQARRNDVGNNCNI